MFRFVMNRVRGTNINYVGTIYRMNMLIELAEVNQFFVFKFKCSLYNDNLFKIFRANKKGSYYTSTKLADSCLLLCPLDKPL
jgi:hypothetical protein